MDIKKNLTRDPLGQAAIKLTDASVGREHISLQAIITAAGTEGPALAAALLTLPFLQPIPLPGISTVLGLGVAACGVSLFRGREVRLPTRIASQEMPTKHILKAVTFLVELNAKLKRYIQYDSGLTPGFVARFSGIAIAIHGFLLALPLPIPFSNSMPAFMCFAAALTALFASRRLLMISLALLLLNIAFWTTLVVASIWGSTALVEWLGVKF